MAMLIVQIEKVTCTLGFGSACRVNHHSVNSPVVILSTLNFVPSR